MDKGIFDKKIQNNPFIPVWQAVYECLQDEIITMYRKPGTKVNAAQIAMDLSVSRSPVHQALDCLISDGLVVQTSKKGYAVSMISRQDCIDLYHARMCIEGPAAYKAAKLISTEKLAELQRVCNMLGELRDKSDELNFQKYARYDDRFHQIIIDAVGNPYISSMYACISKSLRRYRYYLRLFSYPYCSFEELHSQHQVICNALRERYAIVAQKEIENDIALMMEAVGRSYDFEYKKLED